MEEIKFTKKDCYAAIKTLLEGGSTEVPAATLIEFCDKETEALNARAAKAAERQAAKRAAGDELRGYVLDALTDEPTMVADITAKVKAATGDEELTNQKIQVRLKQLVDLGQASKDTVKIEVTNDEGKTKKVSRVVYVRG